MSTEEETFGEHEEEQASAENDAGGNAASRARNRTVMLTPEITGEVRARLAQDLAAPEPEPVAPAAPPKAAPRKAGSAPAPVESPSFETPVPAAAPAAVSEAPAGANYRVREGVMYTKKSPISGFLISYDSDENGEVFELRKGRLIVTSEQPGAGNYLVIDDSSVSSMHAILRVAGFGEIQILDQLSEFGTKIVRAKDGKEEELSGDKSTIKHGDKVVFGERTFFVCLINKEE